MPAEGEFDSSGGKVSLDEQNLCHRDFSRLRNEAFGRRTHDTERLAAASPALIQIAETPPMDAQENLERLMALYQEGDLGAATALIHAVSPRLYRFLAARTVSRLE